MKNIPCTNPKIQGIVVQQSNFALKECFSEKFLNDITKSLHERAILGKGEARKLNHRIKNKNLNADLTKLFLYYLLE